MIIKKNKKMCWFSYFSCLFLFFVFVFFFFFSLSLSLQNLCVFVSDSRGGSAGDDSVTISSFTTAKNNGEQNGYQYTSSNDDTDGNTGLSDGRVAIIVVVIGRGSGFARGKVEDGGGSEESEGLEASRGRATGVSDVKRAGVVGQGTSAGQSITVQGGGIGTLDIEAVGLGDEDLTGALVGGADQDVVAASVETVGDLMRGGRPNRTPLGGDVLTRTAGGELSQSSMVRRNHGDGIADAILISRETSPMSSCSMGWEDRLVGPNNSPIKDLSTPERLSCNEGETADEGKESEELHYLFLQ